MLKSDDWLMEWMIFFCFFFRFGSNHFESRIIIYRENQCDSAMKEGREIDRKLYKESKKMLRVWKKTTTTKRQRIKKTTKTDRENI